VTVTGRLRYKQWTTNDGERRSRLQVVAESVAFLDKPKTAEAEGCDRDEVPDRPAVGADRRKPG
jgi:single-stranded DNA-binding protein